MMTGSVESIELSLAKIWHSWYTFKQGKKKTLELEAFSYNLEANLFQLYRELNTGSYLHGSYKTFQVTDTKRRNISVASIRDRVVHRLLYDYLVEIFDKTFIYDAWSCRKDKGLLAAIERTQYLLTKYRHAYVWRSDITKFFDSMDHAVLKEILKRRVHNLKALQLINVVIKSYSHNFPGVGIPIGNLTSQIFTNIYLHELDRYVLNTIKPLAYIRYGDDFLVIVNSIDYLKYCREHLIVFIDQMLKLTTHSTNDIIVPVRQGVHFLGCDIFPSGRRLRKVVYNRIRRRLNLLNSSSYKGLFLKHSKHKMIKWVDWNILEIIDQL